MFIVLIYKKYLLWYLYLPNDEGKVQTCKSV